MPQRCRPITALTAAMIAARHFSIRFIAGELDPMATPHCSAAGQRSNDGRVRAETPPRRRDVTDYSSALKNQALANRVVDLTPKCLDSMPRRHVTDAVIWLPRLSGRRSYDD